MYREQKIRAFLFYLSALVFIIGLPFILSFALGYKFDRRTFKFTKTGLIVLKTQPSGADIYLDKKLLNIKTPATITEVLPGRYQLNLELEKHYPWFNEVDVEAGKVTRLEKVILFPLRPNIKQLNKERLSFFWVDEDKDSIYYIDPEDKNIYKSDLEGGRSEQVSSFIEIAPAAVKWKLSPDREKLLYFNIHQIGITYLQPQNKLSEETPFILNYSDGRIIDVFWHSDSYHIILVSNRGIEVLEARPQAKNLTLVNLNKRNTSCLYDIHTDTLYFLDSQRAADGNFYDNLYKLEVGAKTFPFQELIKLSPNE